MRRGGWLLVGLVACAALAGCVERRMVIVTEPYGAIVYDERNLPLGASPADRTFTYYGKYRFRIVKDGYETLVVTENVKAPFYQWFGFDFVSENLIPWTIRDVRYFRYQLQPAPIVPPEMLLQQAQQLQAQGRLIGTGASPIPPSPVAPPGVNLPPPPAPIQNGPPPQSMPIPPAPQLGPPTP